MNVPLISIIVPVYNAEKTLKNCIESIIDQTFSNWELILIDDGSNDSSAIICAEYVQKDERISFYSQDNKGVSYARNVGLDHAVGDWIAFCDADDIVYPGWLENYVINVSKEVDLICQSFETNGVIPRSLPNKRRFGFNYCGNVKEGTLLLDENAILGYIWVKLFKRSILNNNSIRFDTRFRHREDVEFCRHYLIYCHKILCTDKIGYFYNVPDWSLKYSDWNNNLFELYKLLFEYAICIFEGENNSMVSRSIDELTGFVLDLYRSNNSACRSYLKSFRSIVKEKIFFGHLFFLTKWLIYIDKFALVSHVFLRTHATIKKLFS